MDTLFSILGTIFKIFLPVFLLGNCTGACVASKAHSAYCNTFGPWDSIPIHEVEGWEDKMNP